MTILSRDRNTRKRSLSLSANQMPSLKCHKKLNQLTDAYKCTSDETKERRDKKKFIENRNSNRTKKMNTIPPPSQINLLSGAAMFHSEIPKILRKNIEYRIKNKTIISKNSHLNREKWHGFTRIIGKIVRHDIFRTSFDPTFISVQLEKILTKSICRSIKIVFRPNDFNDQTSSQNEIALRDSLMTTR